MIAEISIGKPVTFMFIDKLANGKEQLAETFHKNTVKDLEISLLNNRIVYFKIFDREIENYVDYTIRFSSVHKKH